MLTVGAKYWRESHWEFGVTEHSTAKVEFVAAKPHVKPYCWSSHWKVLRATAEAQRQPGAIQNRAKYWLLSAHLEDLVLLECAMFGLPIAYCG